MTFSMGFLPLIDPPLIIPERDLVACVAVRVHIPPMMVLRPRSGGVVVGMVVTPTLLHD